jgi:hypothetical protein
VDVERPEHGRSPLIDADHENWPDPAYCPQIAGSFSAFLDRALRSKGTRYYLQSAGAE